MVLRVSLFVVEKYKGFRKWARKKAGGLSVLCAFVLRWLFPILLISTVAAFVLAVTYDHEWFTSLWCWLRDGTTSCCNTCVQESHGATLRNIGLALAAIFGLLLAWWRSCVADQQTKVSERILHNDQYLKAVELLGNEQMVVRNGAIRDLQRLAAEHPQEWHCQIMDLFCAFIKHPPCEARKHDQEELEADVQHALIAIAERSEEQLKWEEIEGYRIDLEDANLTGARLFKAFFGGANLDGVRFDHATLWECDFDGASLVEAVFDGAFLRRSLLRDADMRGASFKDAKMEDADMTLSMLVKAGFQGARMRGANLTSAVLADADFAGADFLGDEAELSDPDARTLAETRFTDAITDGVLWRTHV